MTEREELAPPVPRMTDSYEPGERELLRAVRDLVRADRDMRRRLGASMHMNLTDLQALRHVIDAEVGPEGFTTPRRLAEHLGISTASTTTLVDRLVASGHLERRPHPTDRRSVVVAATEQAHEEVRAHLLAMHERMREIAAAVPVDARPAVVSFLRALTEEMEKGLLDVGGARPA